MRRSKTWFGALTAALAACVGTSLAAPAATAAGTQSTTSGQVLFQSGTAGYGCFRIPTLVRTKADSLLAFAEARTSPSCADRGDIDIVVRRSTNDGATWGPVRVVTSGTAADPDAPYTRGNPAPVVDVLGDGRISLLSTGEEAIPTHGGTRTAYAQESLDDGLSFSVPREIKRFAGANAGGWFGTGPAHGIQLTEGADRGRLVVGAYEDAGTGRMAGYLHSDDGGRNWSPHQTAVTPAATAKPGEPAVAELPGGGVYIGARNEASAADGPEARTYAISRPGTTEIPAQAKTDLRTPGVQASVLTLRHTYAARAGDLMILAAPTGTPTNANDRANLKIHYSTKEGTAWTPAATIKTGPAGYSDLAELGNGRIALVHEGGKPGTPTKAEGEWSSANIYFRSLDPAGLGLPVGHTPATPATAPAPAAVRTSPDTTPEANDASLTPDAVVGGGCAAGCFGKGLVLSGGAHADVPYARSLDPGSGDFAYSLRFQHDAATAPDPSVLFWAYGDTPAAPQIWVRVDPKANRIHARVQGTGATATASLTVPKAFGDGLPHHLALTRAGSAIELQVDGLKGTATGEVKGSVTDPVSGANSGIRLGAKQDAEAHAPFTGTLDEFRVHRAHLGDDRIKALKEHNAFGAAGGPKPVVHLPFQVIDFPEQARTSPVSIVDDVSGKGGDGSLINDTYTRHPKLAAGRIDGSALPVHPEPAGDGTTDAEKGVQGVYTPLTPSLDRGDKDFTYSLWFKAAELVTTRQSLLMAYGNSDAVPSLWARVERDADSGNSYVHGGARTTDGLAEQRLYLHRDPGNPDPWRLLTLTRSNGRFSLGVDTDLAPGVPVTGSFRKEGVVPFGLRVGSEENLELPGRPPAHVLQGLLDDVRLYDHALTEAEIKGMYPKGGANPKNGLNLRWSMENGNTQIHEVMRPAPTGLSTPDGSRHHNHAYVSGAVTREGKDASFGRALQLNRVDGTVCLPYTDSEALGAGDFTLATLFSYDQNTTASQAVVWGYGSGTTERQLRVRVEDRSGTRKIVAYVQTDSAEVQLVADAPGGGWHHVALTRSGGLLTLLLDGKIAKTGQVSGYLTQGDAFDVQGLRLGDRPTGGNPLRGSLDEFRVYRKALGEAEVNDLWLTNTAPPAVPAVVHLPFDVVVEGSYARM